MFSSLRTPKRKLRFEIYSPLSDLNEPSQTGLIAGERDFELGTPNFERRENVTLVASNTTTKESLYVHLKWRPQPETCDESATIRKRSVTLESRLQFITAQGDEYEHESIETYEPSVSQVRPGRILQFGSPSAKLKLFIASPYRRMRLLFNGHLRKRSKSGAEKNHHQETGANNNLVYLKLGCVLNPIAKIYDFLEQYDEQCVKQVYEMHKPAVPLQQFLENQLLHDLHEQRVQFNGEYLLGASGSTSGERIRQTFTLWGFHARNFLQSSSQSLSDPQRPPPPPLRIRRIYASMDNGQSFHIGSSWQASSGEESTTDGAMANQSSESGQTAAAVAAIATTTRADFGYTNFDMVPATKPIEQPFKLDWDSLVESSNAVENKEATNGQTPSTKSHKLELEISGQSQTFTCNGNRRAPKSCWFDVEMNGKPGWAWQSFPCEEEAEEVAEGEFGDSVAATQRINRSHSDRLLAIKLGQVVNYHHHHREEVLGQQQAAPPAGDESEQPLVLRLDEISCSDHQLVGSKAASLAQLRSFAQNDKISKVSSFQVPGALVLTRHAHDLLMEPQDEKAMDGVNGGAKCQLHQAVSDLKQLVTTQLEAPAIMEACKRVQELVSQKALPERLCSELEAKMSSCFGPLDGGKEQRFAVRSSSWGEDEEGMSAAGQLSTVLNVSNTKDALQSAVLLCFASKFSYENVQYKRLHGLPLDLPMAVIVQEMVDCSRAGVMFTCDPLEGDDSLLTITANFGLGESVVSGEADPDTIEVRLNMANERLIAEDSFTIEKITIGSKKVIRRANDAESSNKLAEEDTTKCCLSEEEIGTLVKCALELKQYFEGQRDIEWGYVETTTKQSHTGEGQQQQKPQKNHHQLLLFQARPITSLEGYSQRELLCEADKPSARERIFFTRANIGEVMPFALKPITLTYSVFNWQIGGARLLALAGGNLQSEYTPQCSSEVYYQQYHTFFNIVDGIVLSLSSNKSVMSTSMEIGFFGREMGDQPDIVEAARGFVRRPDLFMSERFRRATWRFRWFPTNTVLSERPALERMRDQMDQPKLAPGYIKRDETVISAGHQGNINNLAPLYEQMKTIGRGVFDCWVNHILVIRSATGSNMVLSGILSAHIKDPLQLSAATNKFLAITPDVISAEIPARVERMARLVEKSGAEEMDRFIAMSSEEALEYCRSSSPELGQQFDQFLQRFGHRSYNEFELAQLAWRETPHLIAEMIQKNCRALATEGAALGKLKLKTFDEVVDSLEGLREKLSWRERLLLRHSIVPKCQLMLALREQSKDILVMHSDMMRRACRSMAHEMQLTARLPDSDLFYYLFYDEIEPLVAGHQPSIVMQAMRRRQMFKRTFDEETPWKFDEIIRDIVPNHLKASEKLDATLLNAPKLFGTPASSGKIQAKICLVESYKQLDRAKAGTILLTHSTDIAFSPVFPLICGIITEVGGLISHGAVVAREYGLPSVIGIPNITKILQDGEEILLDADNGTIVRLSMSNTDSATAAAAAAPEEQ